MKKNNKLIVIISIIVIILCLIFILINIYNHSRPSKDNIEVNVYSKIKLSELVTIENGILLNDRFIDTEKIGELQVAYSYLNNTNEKKHDSITINVVDKVKPYIGLGKSYTYIIGTDFNIEKSVLCGDNYTRNPNCYITGNYDLEKVGEYPLTFNAEDESGNVNSVNFILNVVEKRNSSNSSNSISLEEINSIKPSNASLMIDVSKWQKDIDWQEVYNSGIRYVMIRIGTQIGVNQTSKIDDYFRINIEKAKNAGLKIGVYYYSYANDTNDAKNQAEWVLAILDNYDLDLPVAFDWECWSLFNSFNINFHDLNEIADTFLKTIKQSGYQAILYGSKNYIENIWDSEHDIWLAHYTAQTTYEGNKVMWQFTNSGKIPGIKGKTDVNFFYNK